jgi:hypothetical protein
MTGYYRIKLKHKSKKNPPRVTLRVTYEPKKVASGSIIPGTGMLGSP